MLQLTPLEWDSTFFGKKIARLQATTPAEALAGLRQPTARSYDLIYVVLPGDVPITQPVEGLTLVDQQVVYKHLIDPLATYIKAAAIQTYHPSTPEERFYQLTLRSGHRSRFKVDPRFPQVDFERLYRKWADNAVNRSFAEVVFVYKEEQDLQGMMTLVTKNGVGEMQLLAVAEEAGRRGIGLALLQTALHYFQKKGLDHFILATQRDNLPACAFYEKNGFTIQSISNIYHYWQ
jgi:ribosomal protein S18 acetylase RimI-like enzyme